MRRMPQARGHKARYREEAFYELEKVAKQHFNNDNVKLDVKASYIGSKIFEADHVYKSFGDLKILEDFSYIFARYEKMGIVGNNGTGKSTFIKILMGEQKADSGTIDIGETVRFGYYSQDGLQFDEQMKVIDVVQDIAEVIELGNGKKLTASQFLQHFLFTPETQHSYVYKLSGGERRRLYLCTVLMQNPNFLVLDEPTNDLDIITLNVLEEYLQNFRGCVIVVSHDRYFMDKVVDHLLVFNGQADIRDFPGNYTQYRDWKDEKARLEKEKEKEAVKPQEDKTAKVRLNEKRRMSFKEKREFEQLEEEIATLFPSAKVERLDFDTARTRAAYERIIADFEKGKTQILIGTQMLSKGLDFGNVSVVGILNADSLMNFPDFRAHERAFQLMVQVSGRAGRRDKRGTVVLQTSQPDHPLIRMVERFAYKEMVRLQLGERSMFRYPPYYRLIVIVLRSRNDSILQELSVLYAENLRRRLGERVLGPVTPPITRVQTLHIRKIVLKIEIAAAIAPVREILESVHTEMQRYLPFKQLIVHYDVDPA